MSAKRLWEDSTSSHPISESTTSESIGGGILESQGVWQPPMSEGTLVLRWLRGPRFFGSLLIKFLFDSKNTNNQNRIEPGTLPPPNMGMQPSISETPETSPPAKIGRGLEKIEGTGDCCFVCSQQNNDYAIKISIPKSGGETAVFRRLRQAIFKYHGLWKVWLPLYGVNNAQEIKFIFDDIRGKDGRIPIQVTYRTEADICRILEDANETIANGPSAFDYEYHDACWGAPDHTPECLINQDHGDECIQDKLAKAKKRINSIYRRHWLKECLQSPSKAEYKLTLNGMLQESFVYLSSKGDIIVPTNGDELRKCREMRGLYVSLGWQLGGVLSWLRLGAAWAFFGLAVVWVGTIAWAGPGGDWSTAMAFGQLIAACFGLIFHYT